MAKKDKKGREPGKRTTSRADARTALLGLLQSLVQLATLITWVIWRHF